MASTKAKPATPGNDQKLKDERNEQKAAKFRELASKRVAAMLDAFRLLGNLGSANYVRTPEQVKAICTRLRAAIDQLEKDLDPKNDKAKDAPTFELP